MGQGERVKGLYEISECGVYTEGGLESRSEANRGCCPEELLGFSFPFFPLATRLFRAKCLTQLPYGSCSSHLALSSCLLPLSWPF